MPKVTVTFSEAQARAVNAALAFAHTCETAAEQRAARNARVMLQSAMEGRGVALIEPEPTDGPVVAYGEPGVGHDIANHDLVLTWRKPAGFETAVEARIPVEAITDFIRQSANVGMSALEGAITAIGYGECETCKNVRLVDVELSGGRKSNAPCPTCRGSKRLTSAKVLTKVPTVGPKVKPRVETGWAL